MSDDEPQCTALAVTHESILRRNAREAVGRAKRKLESRRAHDFLSSIIAHTIGAVTKPYAFEEMVVRAIIGDPIALGQASQAVLDMVRTNEKTCQRCRSNLLCEDCMGLVVLSDE